MSTKDQPPGTEIPEKPKQTAGVVLQHTFDQKPDRTRADESPDQREAIEQPRGDANSAADLVAHVQALIAAASLHSLLHALVEVCHRNTHDYRTVQSEQTDLSRTNAANWQALGQRLTEVEESAARYGL